MGRFRALSGGRWVDLEQRLDDSAPTAALALAGASAGLESSFRVLSDVARLLVSESKLDTTLEAVADGLNGLVRGNDFSVEEFGLAKRFAELAALAIDNAQIRQQLKEELVADPLTGLPNHRRFQELLDEGLSESVANGRPLSLISIDIDDFK